MTGSVLSSNMITMSKEYFRELVSQLENEDTREYTLQTLRQQGWLDMNNKDAPPPLLLKEEEHTGHVLSFNERFVE